MPKIEFGKIVWRTPVLETFLFFAKISLLVLCLSFKFAIVAYAASALPEEEASTRSSPEPGLLLLGMASSLTNPSKVHIVSTNKMNYSGQLPAGFSAQMLPLPSEGEIAVASTYYSRMYRGERTDVLEIWDKATLTFKKELVIPSIRALYAASRSSMAETLDHKFILIQNATPASSITVVDVANWKVAGEIPDPGCFGIYLFPDKPRAFGSLCGDGKMALYTIDDQGFGKFAGTSEKLFDPETDPVYMFVETHGNQFIMLSFNGNVRIVDVTGGQPKLTASFSIVDGFPDNWRPGGYQPFAYNPKNDVLFVLMHKNGKEGSHKLVAEEIWAINVATHKVLSRSPCEAIDSLVNIPGDKPIVVGSEPGNDYLNQYEADPLANFKLQRTYYEYAGPWIPHLEVMQ